MAAVFLPVALSCLPDYEFLFPPRWRTWLIVLLNRRFKVKDRSQRWLESTDL